MSGWIVHAWGMNYQRQLWGRLIVSLNQWTSAAEVAPGRVEVLFPSSEGSCRRVVIVMTPDEWGDMASVMWRNFDDAVQDVK